MLPRTTIVAKSYNKSYRQWGYAMEALFDFCSSCSWKETKVLCFKNERKRK